MKIIDSIQSVFDGKKDSCCCVNNVWTITESKQNATLKKVVFVGEQACFGILGNDFYKGIKDITERRSSFLRDKDCDGVAFYDNTKQTRLLFIDLKSSFSIGNIVDAFKQDFFSFLKLHMLLSLCEGYFIKSFKIAFYSASQPCQSQEDEDRIKDDIQMNEELERGFESKCLYNYFFLKEPYSCKLYEVPFLTKRNIKLNEDLMNSTFNFYIVTSEKYGDSEATVNLA